MTTDMNPISCRHDWTPAEVESLFRLPFMELLYRAHTVHRACFDPNAIQFSTLISIKTGGCPEDCAYCPQSAHYETGVEKESLVAVARVRAEARAAKARGATRFCMGAAWKNPPARDFQAVLDMVRGVKELGLESCATLGSLSPEQAKALKDAGLDYYNHNLDTSPEYYGEIITTRTYRERLDTLALVRGVGMKVCCGGIVGMGESTRDRARLLQELANLPRHPESVPINLLVRIEGTPLADAAAVDPFDFVRAVAVARILMPRSRVRLAAGRHGMSEELQALCLFAGANSVFFGEKLLTAPNAAAAEDMALLAKLGMRPEETDGARALPGKAG